MPSRFDSNASRQINEWLDSNLARFASICRQVHANPELSGQEEKTAALVAHELRAAGCSVSTRLGGHGVAGVLVNGAGPCVLVRGDMDALPIIEDTGLPYASAVRCKRADGAEVGVMHACGHDIHTSMLIGTAHALAASKNCWRGTILFIGQPSEETGNGADRMVRDGLFERVPRPDYCLALHVAPDLPVGQVGCTSGWATATVDSVDITIFGRGGHGARPNLAVDPIVAAAYVITQLQTLVSRRVDPLESAVVTVGAIHGGSKHNVIPVQLRMQLTVRSYTDAVRRQLLEGIRQITTQVCAGFGCPRVPDVVVDPDSTPASFNDPALASRATEVFRGVFGEENVIYRPAKMWSEDFGFLPRAAKAPGIQFDLGCVARERFAASQQPGGEELPSVHSSSFAPDLEPTLRAGILAMGALTLTLLAEPPA
jgi:hippurate hydrolase